MCVRPTLAKGYCRDKAISMFVFVAWWQPSLLCYNGATAAGDQVRYSRSKTCGSCAVRVHTTVRSVSAAKKRSQQRLQYPPTSSTWCNSRPELMQFLRAHLLG